MKKYKLLNKLNEISENYNAFIIDIWGVLWDGIEPYKGAISSLRKIKKSNKNIILLSNAPRRSDLVATRLESIGIDNTLFDTIISSGEVCREDCLDKNKTLDLGEKYYFIGQKEDKGIALGLNIKEVNEIKNSSFLLVCGTRDFDHTLDNYIKELNEGLKFKLPLVCANPDKVVIRKNGKLITCAGLLADYYQKNGGKVLRYGKPYEQVYKKSIRFFKTINANILKKDILVIGDSLETDILGANNIGFDSLLITNGIHKNELYQNNKSVTNSKSLDKLFKKFSVVPNFIIKNFVF